MLNGHRVCPDFIDRHPEVPERSEGLEGCERPVAAGELGPSLLRGSLRSRLRMTDADG